MLTPKLANPADFCISGLPIRRAFFMGAQMFASPTIQIIIALVIALIGFGSGWGVKGWKDGAEVALAVSAKEKVESRNAILEAANTNCATDIEGVRKGVAIITQAVAEREKAASDAMKQAQVVAAKHSTRANAIKNLPPVPQERDAQCAAIVQEQINYVEGRHE